MVVSLCETMVALRAVVGFADGSDFVAVVVVSQREWVLCFGLVGIFN